MATIMSTPPRRPRYPRSDTRTSYQVGKPWILDGKMLRGLTGTPMRRIALANIMFAEADPDPLTLANLITKSLVLWIGCDMRAPRESFPARISACPTRRWDNARRKGCSAGTRPRP